MFIPFLFLCYIHFVISLSNEEDLSITKYTQIGCLVLKSDKQYLVNNIQENFLLSYQTFSSSDMTIELCFRLCRRWIVLLFNNQKTCICLYTINKPYEFNEYLGEFLSNNSCQTNNIEIYSLTDDAYILPSLLTSTTDDWSFDGCYYLHGIQNIRVDTWLNDVDYIQALDLCRKRCHTSRETNHYSFYLSRKKSCYCAPLDFTQITKTMALRKPLIHCSFLPYICQGFPDTCQQFNLKADPDTLIKIDVQHYCLSIEFLSFIFDRIFYMCFKTILLSTQITFSIINSNQKCLPLIIKTYQQWHYLIQSSWITYSKTFISIDKNSNYIYKNLFQTNNLTLISTNLCLVIYRTYSNQIVYELIQCIDVHSPGYVLCAHKPIQSTISYQEEFHSITTTESSMSSNEILSCPSEFVLFNNMCYYIHLSFIYDIQTGEHLCYNNYSKSKLVKFDSYDWGNINATKFLGRIIDDILLELFYYLLEKKLFNQIINQSNKKHWLRLLIGDKNDPNECYLRYYTRSLGGFTTIHRCNNGGHPVCQTQPIRTKISSINPTTFNTNNSSIETTTTTTTTATATATPTTISTTTPVIILNSTTVLICENCTTTTPIADDDLINNETDINSDLTNKTLIDVTNRQSKKKALTYRPLLLILTGPALALIILFVSIGLLIHHLRKNRGSYSTGSSIVGSRRTKRSSTTLTASDIPNTPAVLYTRLKSSRLSITETDMLLPLDNSLSPTDDNIEMLPATKIQIINPDENQKKLNEEESLYATLN